MEAYLEYMVQVRIISTFLRAFFHERNFKVGVLLGGEKSSTTEQMQQVIDFETELAKITTPSDERRDEEKLYHSMSISKLQAMAPFVSLASFARHTKFHFMFYDRFLGLTTSTRHLR